MIEETRDYTTYDGALAAYFDEFGEYADQPNSSASEYDSERNRWELRSGYRDLAYVCGECGRVWSFEPDMA